VEELSRAQRLAALAVLGLAEGASADQVTRAYRSLAKQTHPDATGHSEAEALQRFAAIHDAYERLCEAPTPQPGRLRPRRDGAEPRSVDFSWPRPPIVAGPVTITALPDAQPSSGGPR
jgi:hypothetical protein